MKWAALTHAIGLVLFYVGWHYTFGVEPRVIPKTLDIFWPIADLLLTGAVSGTFSSVSVYRSIVERRWVVLFLGAISVFFSSAWVFAGGAILGWW